MTTTINQRFAVGEKLRFAEEPKRSYTIQAMNARYAICTRKIYIPSRQQHTVLYTIVDSETMMRGPNNLIFNGYDYATKLGCEESLRALEDGEIELSRRNSIPVLLAF